ncbi:hypothetical protein STEG23_006879 [Scotinomys teguina]
MCRLSWFLDPGGWSKTAAVGLYFIFPGIYTLSLRSSKLILPELSKTCDEKNTYSLQLPPQIRRDSHWDEDYVYRNLLLYLSENCFYA